MKKNQYRLNDTEKKQYTVVIANTWLQEHKRKLGLPYHSGGMLFCQYVLNYDHLASWSLSLQSVLKARASEIDRVAAVLTRGRQGGFHGIEVTLNDGTTEMLDANTYMHRQPFNGDTQFN